MISPEEIRAAAAANGSIGGRTGVMAALAGAATRSWLSNDGHCSRVPAHHSGRRHKAPRPTTYLKFFPIFQIGWIYSQACGIGGIGADPFLVAVRQKGHPNWAGDAARGQTNFLRTAGDFNPGNYRPPPRDHGAAGGNSGKN